MNKILITLLTAFTSAIILQSNTLQAVQIEVTQIDLFNSSGVQGDPLYISSHPQYLDSTTNTGFFITTPFLGNDLWGSVYESYDNPGEYITTPIGYQSINGADGYSFTLSAGEVAFSICVEMGTASCMALLAVFEDHNQDGIWNSVDTDNDGITGTTINNGLFPSFTFALTGVTPVPLPASLWLFLTGIISLFGYNFKNKCRT